MRAYIYTSRERRVLADWLRGITVRGDSRFLDHVLSRTRSNYGTLTIDIRFFILTIRKLNAGRPRRRRSDLDVTLAITPLTIKAVNIEKYALLPMLRYAEEIANNQSNPTDMRLDAFEEVVRLAKEMEGVSKDKFLGQGE